MWRALRLVRPSRYVECVQLNFEQASRIGLVSLVGFSPRLVEELRPANPRPVDNRIGTLSSRKPRNERIATR